MNEFKNKIKAIAKYPTEQINNVEDDAIFYEEENIELSYIKYLQKNKKYLESDNEYIKEVIEQIKKSISIINNILECDILTANIKDIMEKLEDTELLICISGDIASAGENMIAIMLELKDHNCEKSNSWIKKEESIGKEPGE